MRIKAVMAGALALTATVLATGTGGAAVDDEEAALRRIRQLSGRYHSAVQAERDGFAATDDCVAEPGRGMGYHYVNFGRVDFTYDVDKPEAVLYTSGPGGERVLTAVEYIVVDADQNLATSGDRPSLGGHQFDGPMPGHFPGMPVHYDLHVWAWADNPDGAFTAWNPAIGCP